MPVERVECIAKIQSMWVSENNLAIASILLEVHSPKAEAAQEAIAIYVATPVSERSPNNGLPKA